MYRVPPRRGAGGRLEEHAVEQVFEIVISSCENCTWQGTLRAGGEAVPFQSELELLVELALSVSYTHLACSRATAPTP